MERYKKNNPKGKNGSIAILSGVMLALGATLLILGYNIQILSWMKKYGIVFIVVGTPILVLILYRIILKKVKEI